MERPAQKESPPGLKLMPPSGKVVGVPAQPCGNGSCLVVMCHCTAVLPVSKVRLPFGDSEKIYNFKEQESLGSQRPLWVVAVVGIKTEMVHSSTMRLSHWNENHGPLYNSSDERNTHRQRWSSKAIGHGHGTRQNPNPDTEPE